MYIIYVNNTLPLAHEISRHFWAAYGVTRRTVNKVHNGSILNLNLARDWISQLIELRYYYMCLCLFLNSLNDKYTF